MSNHSTHSPATQAGKSAMSTSQGQGSTTSVPHEKIAMRAYEKWCQRGCPQGTHQQDWLDAENELRTEMMGQTGQVSGRTSQPMQQPSAASRPAQAPPMPQKSAQRR